MEIKSTLKQKRKPGRQRRQYTDEFKAGAVRLVVVEGRTIAQVARDLDLTRSALDGWVTQSKADALRERVCVRFAFIDVERATWPVTVLCRSLLVSTAGFYVSTRRTPSPRRLGVA